MYQLIIEDSAGDVIVVPLQHQQISVGRQKGNVVRLTDQNVSRRHARLFRQNGQEDGQDGEDARYFVEDLESYLGTIVNGARISERRALSDGDQVVIGDYRLTVARADAAARVGKARARRRIPWAAAANWVSGAGDRAAALFARLKGSLTAPSSWPGWIKVAMADGASASLALGLPMVSDGGSSGGGGPPGGETRPTGRVSGSFSPIEPRIAKPVSLPPTSATSRPGVGRQILRLRGTLVLGVVALVMVIVGVVFAPRDGQRGLVSAVRKVLPEGAAGVESPGSLLYQAQTAYSKGRWADTLLLLARVSAMSPGLAEAENLKRATLAERKNQASIEAAERALDLENYGLVLEQVASVSAQSAYRDRAQVLGAAARANLVAQHLSSAQSRQAAGDCRMAVKEAEAALALERDNPTAKELLARCPRSLASRSSSSAARASTRSKRLLAVSHPPKTEPPAPEPRRALVGTSDGVLPPIFSSPVEKTNPRRPIESANPYAGDLR
jgi:pSer/pThr/pTyr-binding forkhead associated (FHA) protein